jgi:nicotinamide phosphoribosyltransferase
MIGGDKLTDNMLLMTDSYKPTHHSMANPNITKTYAYMESRGGLFREGVFFGLQGMLQEYFEGPRFNYNDISEAQDFWSAHFGRDDCFDHVAWVRLLEKHEGRIVPSHTPFLTVENTDPEFPWLPMFIEPVLIKLWAPIAVASQSHFLRQQIRSIGLETSDDIDAIIDFMVHDFGFRGVSSNESARILGAAHLTSFMGTDNVQGIRYLQKHYQDSTFPSMYGYSVPASEHSVILGYETEYEAFYNVLKAYPEGIVACVSDTNDIYAAVNYLWGETFKERVEQRKGRLVIRPDSGDPLEVVINVLDDLGRIFGKTKNKKGYWVLPDFVRVIQGDGMNVETIPQLYKMLVAHKWAPDNLVIGSGGGLLQSLTRDTMRIAYKPSQFGYKDGTTRDVSKNPVTDPSKRSRAGRFAVVRNSEGKIDTVAETSQVPNLLTPVFEDGTILRETTIEKIRMEVK